MAEPRADQSAPQEIIENLMLPYRFLSSMAGLETNKVSLKVLDIAAGNNLQRDIFPDLWNVTSVDVEAAPRYDVIQGDIRNLDFADQSFDLVFSCETIEHLTISDQYTALLELARVKRINGKLIVGSVNLSGPSHIGPHPIWKNVLNEHHIHEHTSKSFQELMTEVFGNPQFWHSKQRDGHWQMRRGLDYHKGFNNYALIR